MSYEPTHLDLFSGIGGFALAAQWAGFRTIGFAEIDPYASAVLKKHWPEVQNYGDVRELALRPISGIDLITGGFPCQPFSQVRQAGNGKGTGDNRYLWPTMLQIITEARPPWVVGENVNGIIDLALDTVCTDLEAAGYEVQPLVIPACALDAAHIRERVWILAYSTGQRCVADAEVHPWAVTQGGREKQATGPHRRRLVELAASNCLAVQRLERPEDHDDDAGDIEKFDGLPEELDAVRAYGNAIVPQVAYPILKAIREIIGNENEFTRAVV